MVPTTKTLEPPRRTARSSDNNGHVGRSQVTSGFGTLAYTSEYLCTALPDRSTAGEGCKFRKLNVHFSRTRYTRS